MTGSTYAPLRWSDLAANCVQTDTIGATGTITAGATQNVDTLIADDCLIRGIRFVCRNQLFNDMVSISVVDKDNILGHGAGFVLATPVSNWNIDADQQRQADYDSEVPQKILGGLYLRIAYTSTGLITPVNIACNFILLKVLL